jgi:hypothetical protein
VSAADIVSDPYVYDNSFIYSSFTVNSCGEIIMYAAYFVSCLSISILASTGYCGYFCSTVPLLQSLINSGYHENCLTLTLGGNI